MAGADRRAGEIGFEDGIAHAEWRKQLLTHEALGIHRTAEGFQMKLLDDDAYRGTYPSLEVAKSALHAALEPGSEWPEFREH